MRPLIRRLAAAVVVAGVLASCRSTEPGPRTIETTVFADTLGIELSRFTRLPEGLYLRDSLVGTGRPAATGDSVTVRWVGSFPDARVFGENRSPAPEYAFRLGRGQVIPGWELGIRGMRAGGRRQLIIPPELGYGARDYLSVPAGSILVFTIDLVALR